MTVLDENKVDSIRDLEHKIHKLMPKALENETVKKRIVADLDRGYIKIQKDLSEIKNETRLFVEDGRVMLSQFEDCVENNFKEKYSEHLETLIEFKVDALDLKSSILKHEKTLFGICCRLVNHIENNYHTKMIFSGEIRPNFIIRTSHLGIRYFDQEKEKLVPGEMAKKIRLPKELNNEIERWKKRFGNIKSKYKKLISFLSDAERAYNDFGCVTLLLLCNSTRYEADSWREEGSFSNANYEANRLMTYPNFLKSHGAYQALESAKEYLQSMLSSGMVKAVDKESRATRKITWLVSAMLLVKEKPHLHDKEIAEKVGIHPSQLSRNEQYKKAANVVRSPKKNPCRGFITTNESIGGVDGYSSGTDPSEMDWDNE